MNEGDAGISERQPASAQRELDPRYATNDPEHKPSPVWAESQRLRELIAAVREGREPGAAGRTILRDALERQLPTLLLWRHVVAHRKALGTHSVSDQTATLYLIVFPGEGRDNTGLKQLNDKVLGYEINTKFIRARQKAIAEIFSGAPGGGPAFAAVGQDYKTASIIAVGRKREDFAKELVKLDAKLRTLLNAALDEAEEEAKKEKDEKRRTARERAIKDVRKAIKNSKYRFDFLFGAVTRRMSTFDAIETVFLLVTEALKAAGVARFIARIEPLMKFLAARSEARRIAKENRTERDDKKLDNRGKAFDLDDYRRTTRVAQIIRTRMSIPPHRDDLRDYVHIYVNGVWTFPFVIFHPEEERLIANPDVVRDARKRALEAPPLKRGVKFSINDQVSLLELWLTSINVLDLIKDFLVPEFKDLLVFYHDKASTAWSEVTEGRPIDPPRLEAVLTRDLRQGKRPLPVLGRASEFQFYAYTADHADRIFYAMDVRDLGVDLLVPYELSNDAILMRQVRDTRLMIETFWASEPINRRKRATYDAVVDLFRKAHNARRDWKAESRRAFGNAGATLVPMPAFEDSVQIMMGGDEVFVSAHPGYAGLEAEIIKALSERRHKGLPLNIRVAVIYSSAFWAGTQPGSAPTPEQRERNAGAHDQALGLAGGLSATLKDLERRHRRMERLLDKLLEAADKQKKAEKK
jgi:hypothetical protein